MARKSFTARFPASDPDPGFDGLACVSNVAADASTRVCITDIRAMPPTAYNSDTTNPTGCTGILTMLRVYGSSGGTLVTPMKFDTNAAALPSQVEFRTAPIGVDYVTGGVTQIRRLGDVPSFGILQAIPLQAMLRAPGVLDCNDHSGRFVEASDFWHADGIADTEPLVLRENEGIGIAQAQYGMSRSSTWTVTVRVAATGRLYRYRVDHGSPNLESAVPFIWTLRNNTGSGVVLQVMVISDPDVGESNHPRYRIAKTAGIAGFGGFEASVTPVAHDTTNSLSDVACYSGPFRPRLQMEGITQNYWDYGNTPVTTAEQQKAGTFRQFLHGQGMLSGLGSPIVHPGALGYGSSEHEIWPGERRFSGWSEDVIRLLPNESLAVIAGGNGSIETSVLANLDIEIQGYIETASAVYPDPNDVRNNVDYGPTGADYNGDLVIPPENKVESGYSYGADGTEYTGTLVGGSCDYPIAANVRSGTVYSSGALTGTLDLPATGDVQNGVTYDGGTKTGTFVSPATGDVQSGVTYGNAAEFTGTFVSPATGDVQSGVTYGNAAEFTGTFVAPAVGDVQDGVTYGNAAEFTGTLVLPVVGDVQLSVQYGAGGVEFTGTFVVPVISDVRLSVQYGAGGTEFTGTLDPGVGGGGGTIVSINE